MIGATLCATIRATRPAAGALRTGRVGTDGWGERGR
jgi:hypothetical protein